MLSKIHFESSIPHTTLVGITHVEPGMTHANGHSSAHSKYSTMTSKKDATEIRKWYDEYIAADTWKLTAKAPLIKAVGDDELDNTLLEERIEGFRSEVPVTGRFCADCQALFDNWPDLSDGTTVHPDGNACFPGSGADWKHAVAKSCNMIQLEAAARNECLLCALLVQKLEDTEELNVLRRVAARIEFLGESAEIKISLQNWGTNQDQLLWLNWPAKVSTHCNGGSALSQKLVVGALRSDGKQHPARVLKSHTSVP